MLDSLPQVRNLVIPGGAVAIVLCVEQRRPDVIHVAESRADLRRVVDWIASQPGLLQLLEDAIELYDGPE